MSHHQSPKVLDQPILGLLQRMRRTLGPEAAWQTCYQVGGCFGLDGQNCAGSLRRLASMGLVDTQTRPNRRHIPGITEYRARDNSAPSTFGVTERSSGSPTFGSAPSGAHNDTAVGGRQQAPGSAGAAAPSGPESRGRSEGNASGGF